METISILNTEELNLKIEEMFRDEKERLIIVTPFIDIDEEKMSLLSKSPANIHLLIQKPKDNNDSKKVISIKEKLPNVNLMEFTNFHAKAYISKKYSIITSLNLQKYSIENNFELGVLIKNEDHKELYEKLINELREYLEKNEYDKNILD